MSRSIKRISHDLKPMIDGINKININLQTMLPLLFSELAPGGKVDTRISGPLETCIDALNSLNKCAKLAEAYIQDVDAEADREGITKDD